MSSSRNRSRSGYNTPLGALNETLSEDHTQRNNDHRREQGLTPKHCGTEASVNQHGDWACAICGDVFA